MKRVLLSAAAVALSLAVAATAQAGPKGGNRGGSSGNYSQNNNHNTQNVYKTSNVKDYHLSNGFKLKDGGYSYKGKDHHQWAYKCWYAKYGCECYYCPSACCWYYWYPQDSCYYPVSYIPQYTPTYVERPVSYPTGVQQIVNVTNDSPGAGTVAAGGPGGSGPQQLPPPGPPAPPVK